MRALSFLLSFSLHLLVGATFFWASFSPKIHVDMSRKVYDVVLLELPEEKVQPPVPQEPPPAPPQAKDEAPVKVEEPEPVELKEIEPPKKKEVVKAPEPEMPKSPEKKISPKKTETMPKPEPKAETKPKKKEDDRAALKKALGSASNIVENKKKTNKEKLAQELAALQGRVQPQQGNGVGRATLIEIYSTNVKLLIKEHWRWPAFRDMRLDARVLVSLSPEGEILGRKLVKSSGRADFDSSVLRAIDSTKKLPVPPEHIHELELNFNAEEVL